MKRYDNAIPKPFDSALTSSQPTSAHLFNSHLSIESGSLNSRPTSSSPLNDSLLDSTPLDSTPLNSTPLDSRPVGNEFQLTGTRPGLTLNPQMSFADFRVQKTAYGLEIHFSQRRIKERLVMPIAKRQAAEQQMNSESLLSEESAIAVLTVAATLLFVGGAVAITGSIFLGIVIAAFLPCIGWLIAAPKSGKRYGKAILRVSSIPNGRTLLTLKTIDPPPVHSSQTHKRLRANHFAVKSTVQCANLPVRLVQASPKKRANSQLSFVFTPGHKCRGNQQLSITGTRQEIQWLHRHLLEQNTLPTARL